MAFIDTKSVSNITGMSLSQCDTPDMVDFIGYAQTEVLMRIQTLVRRERVKFIDGVRSNEINGQNKRFYLANQGNFVGDYDFNGILDLEDIRVYLVGNNTEEMVTPSRIDYEEMYFELDDAPKDIEMYVSYRYSPVDLSLPDPRLQALMAYLSASYVSISSGDDEGFRIGNVSFGGNNKGIKRNRYYQKFEELLATLMESTFGGPTWGESLVKI